MQPSQLVPPTLHLTANPTRDHHPRHSNLLTIRPEHQRAILGADHITVRGDEGMEEDAGGGAGAECGAVAGGAEGDG